MSVANRKLKDQLSEQIFASFLILLSQPSKADELSSPVRGGGEDEVQVVVVV